MASSSSENILFILLASKLAANTSKNHLTLIQSSESLRRITSGLKRYDISHLVQLLLVNNEQNEAAC